jgi:spore germination cell wall hydrolase CwlJ-like protein
MTPDPTLSRLADQTLLALCIWAEAEGEPPEGQLAVGWVVRNRVEHPCWWGHDYHSVILATWQFSWTDPHCDRYQKAIAIIDSIPDHFTILAENVIQGNLPDPVPGAVCYHAPYCHPGWADHMQFIRQIGRHLFYKEKA